MAPAFYVRKIMGVNKCILDNMKRAGRGAIIAPPVNKANLLRKETSP
jgi:hypothetical protein